MKGICFKEPLFHKIVKGEKTQTRRMTISRTGYFKVESRNGVIFDIWQTNDNEWCGDNLVPVKPKYKVGEVVYLKEPYLYQYDREEKGYKYYYKFSTADILELKVIGVDIKWKNKLFMPKSAARYFIEITAVRAERLQDISDEDCMKEGIGLNPEAIPIGYPFGIKFSYNNGYYNYTTPQEAFAALIDKINGKGTWEKNPWVWVYDFELINK